MLAKRKATARHMLSDIYNQEQREIKETVPKLKERMEELNAEILRTFVAKIVIHKRTQKWSTSAEQQIGIYFRYIGNLSPQAFEQVG